jgi:HK97 family phage portal protein
MRKVSGVKSLAEDHPYYELLHDQPNEWMTSPEFWAMCSAHLDLRGNFYALKSGLPGRRIRELIPLAIGGVEEVIQTPSYGLFYKIRRPTSNNTDGAGVGQTNAGTEADIIPRNRILHIKELSLNGFTGLNPVAYIRERVGLDLALEKHGAKLFKQGTMINGIVKNPHHFKTDAEARQWLSNFNDAFSGVENAWKTALLEDDMSYEKIGMSSIDSQYLETNNFTKKAIVDLFFGLPLSIMSTGDKTATFASASEFDDEFVKFAMLPRLVNIEKASRRDLFDSEEKKIYYAKFRTAALERGNFKERMEGYAIAIDKEIFNPNECRDLEDYNPYSGGEVYRTRTSTTKDSTAKEGATK